MVIFIPLPALSAAFSLDYALGLGGHFQLNAWTPVNVVLENRGRPTRGTLEVIVTSGSEYHQDVYQSTYAKDVDLPHNSKKRYAFTVMIKSFTHDLIIRLRQNDTVIISKSVNLRPHFTEKSFAVVADNFVSPDILSVLPKDLYPVNVRPKFLPETWYGYGSVKLLIMRAAALRELRERQFQALTQWIKQGGYLVTTGSLNYGSLLEKRIQHILPINVFGHKRFFELKSLAHFCSQTLISEEPFLVLNVRIDHSNVLVKEKDIPLIVQKNLGFGQIIFLSFDYSTPPFSRWDGRRFFWDKILTIRPLIDDQGIVLEDQKILDSMLANIPVHFPGLKSAVIFIGIYLVLLRYFLKKIREPGKRRWKNGFFLLLIIAAFTTIGYWRFFYPNSKQKFTYNSFCQLEVSGRNTLASAKYILGLYALKKSAYRVGFGSFSYPVTHALSKHLKKKIPNPYVLHENYNGQQIAGSLDEWSHSFYMIKSTFDSPLEGHALRDPHHLTIKVENKLPHKIVDCLIYFKKRFLVIDDIPANKQQTIKLKLSELKKTEIFNDHEAKQIFNRFGINGSLSYLRISQKNLTKDVLLGIHAKYENKRDSLYLIGWVQGSVIQPEFKQIQPLGENLTLVNWEFTVEMAL
ncbi:MAG: hypothetical protein JSV31_30390 [Desulfobacterales bacterium]|nr:MAG: hypothetical protein JSV31_30390 [Desulfobacterales bacterium]